MTELDRKYNITSDNYGIGNFIEDLKKKGYIFENKSEDKKNFNNRDFRIVSKKKQSKKQFDDIIFDFNISRKVKSKAIV